MPGSDYLSILPNTLSPGKEYVIRVELGGSFNEVQLVTNLPPYGGSCRVDPSRGVAMFAKFIVTCENWMDEGQRSSRDPNEDRLNQFDLHYEFYMKARGSSSTFALFHHGSHWQTPESHITMGYKHYQYTVDIRVKIYDRYRAWSEYNSTVQVGGYGKLRCIISKTHLYVV